MLDMLRSSCCSFDLEAAEQLCSRAKRWLDMRAWHVLLLAALTPVLRVPPSPPPSPPLHAVIANMRGDSPEQVATLLMQVGARNTVDRARQHAAAAAQSCRARSATSHACRSAAAGQRCCRSPAQCTRVAPPTPQEEGLRGLQGPTISPVYTLDSGAASARAGLYACVICVAKKQLYKSVKAIQKVCCVCHAACCVAVGLACRV